MDLEAKSEYWSENFNGLNFTEQEISATEFDGCRFEKCDFNRAIFFCARFARAGDSPSISATTGLIGTDLHL